MPRKNKPIREMTKDEIAERVFPKKVIRELKKIAHEHDTDAVQVGPRRKHKPESSI